MSNTNFLLVEFASWKACTTQMTMNELNLEIKAVSFYLVEPSSAVRPHTCTTSFPACRVSKLESLHYTDDNE